jgi:hypothetical protein
MCSKLNSGSTVMGSQKTKQHHQQQPTIFEGNGAQHVPQIQAARLTIPPNETHAQGGHHPQVFPSEQFSPPGFAV